MIFVFVLACLPCNQDFGVTNTIVALDDLCLLCLRQSRDWGEKIQDGD